MQDRSVYSFSFTFHCISENFMQGLHRRHREDLFPAYREKTTFSARQIAPFRRFVKCLPSESEKGKFGLVRASETMLWRCSVARKEKKPRNDVRAFPSVLQTLYHFQEGDSYGLIFCYFAFIGILPQRRKIRKVFLAVGYQGEHWQAVFVLQKLCLRGRAALY